jgi:hypothetical protein
MTMRMQRKTYHRGSQNRDGFILDRIPSECVSWPCRTHDPGIVFNENSNDGLKDYTGHARELRAQRKGW